METIFILFVLIVALIGLVGVRKENEALENKRNTLYKSYIELITHSNKEEDILNEEIKELQNTNRAYKGANTKHKATIEELEKQIKGLEFNLSHSKQNEIRETNNLIRAGKMLDESYIAINAVGNESNKKKRLELLDIYMNK